MQMDRQEGWIKKFDTASFEPAKGRLQKLVILKRRILLKIQRLKNSILSHISRNFSAGLSAVISADVPARINF